MSGKQITAWQYTIVFIFFSFLNNIGQLLIQLRVAASTLREEPRAYISSRRVSIDGEPLFLPAVYMVCDYVAQQLALGLFCFYIKKKKNPGINFCFIN